MSLNLLWWRKHVPVPPPAPAPNSDLKAIKDTLTAILAAQIKQLTQLAALNQGQEKEMALVTVQQSSIDGLVANVAKLKTDTSTALADIKAKLDAGATLTEDPAAKAALEGAAADIAKLDSDIAAADPGTIAPIPPTEEP